MTRKEEIEIIIEKINKDIKADINSGIYDQVQIAKRILKNSDLLREYLKEHLK
jgi:hypothetical protein